MESLRLKNQLCFPLYAASREVIKRYRPYLDALGITYTQYITMMVLWEERKIGAKELGHKLFLDSGTLTPVLKALEGKGFVRRTRSSSDERALIVEITGSGMALRDYAKDIPQKVAGCISLNANDASELYRILYKILTPEN